MTTNSSTKVNARRCRRRGTGIKVIRVIHGGREKDFQLLHSVTRFDTAIKIYTARIFRVKLARWRGRRLYFFTRRVRSPTKRSIHLKAEEHLCSPMISPGPANFITAAGWPWERFSNRSWPATTWNIRGTWPTRSRTRSDASIPCSPRFDPTSEVFRLNREASGLAVQVSTEIWELLSLCEAGRLRTDGCFDIAAGSGEAASRPGKPLDFLFVAWNPN